VPKVSNDTTLNSSTDLNTKVLNELENLEERYKQNEEDLKG